MQIHQIIETKHSVGKADLKRFTFQLTWCATRLYCFRIRLRLNETKENNYDIEIQYFSLKKNQTNKRSITQIKEFEGKI